MGMDVWLHQTAPVRLSYLINVYSMLMLLLLLLVINFSTLSAIYSPHKLLLSSLLLLCCPMHVQSKIQKSFI